MCDPDDPDPLGPACTTSVTSAEIFDRYSVGPTGVLHWERATKYMVPAVDEPDLIQPLVQNANRYAVHMDFLREMFFPGLTLQTYSELVTTRATRKYFAGNLIRINDPELGVLYGFTVYTAANASEQLEPAEVRRIHQQLSRIVTAGTVVYTFEPFDAMGPRKAMAWIDPGFPIWYPADNDVEVEVYTPGINYGSVRLLTLEEFDAASTAGTLGYRDLLILESVPFDVESVVAGVVTGGRQWELSHVNVRMGRRGTPNFYVKNALQAFNEWGGKLVRFQATQGLNGASDTYEITEATLGEAETWWTAHRPHLEDVPTVDAEYSTLDALTEMNTSDVPVALITRFGGKTANLAKLYSFLDPKYQVPGFGIPFSWFEDFIDENTIQDIRDNPPETVTIREFVARLAADPLASMDPVYRHAVLQRLRSYIKDDSHVPPEKIQELIARIEEVYGSPAVPVRFRSSSNVEDSLEFSGAGLYDSTTVCAADQTDADGVGPSLCNAAEPDERTVKRGLLKVWASLFNDRAWDERDWYQVPQTAASMAILVSLGFPDEAANGVAFTGDPGDPTDVRYLVNAQIGDEKVVSNDPSKVPELDRLEMTDGQVSYIVRQRSSTLATPGVPVMSDEQLHELGAVMAVIDRDYPVSVGTYTRQQILLDMEFKVEKVTGALKIKQIRPFLMSQQGETPP